MGFLWVKMPSCRQIGFKVGDFRIPPHPHGGFADTLSPANAAGRFIRFAVILHARYFALHILRVPDAGIGVGVRAGLLRVGILHFGYLILLGGRNRVVAA